MGRIFGTFRICGSFGVQKWRTDPHSGPKLCYLFQAGIPKIGLLGTSGPQNWPNRPGFDLPRGQNSLPRGEICLGTTDFGLPEAQIRVLGLGSGSPRPSNWPPRGQIWPPEVKNDLWETQNRSPRPKNLSNFPHFENEKNCPVLFWTTNLRSFEISDF